MQGLGLPAAEAIIEAVGVLAAGVVALQISQTVLEEEVVREAHIGAPTRVRRFLSRFMVVIVVAVAVEGLVATFKAREAPELMLHAAAMLGAVGLLMAGWGLFIPPEPLRRGAGARGDGRSQERRPEAEVISRGRAARAR
jgi:hypothetical protein